MLTLHQVMRMKIKSLSKKQAQILTWWIKNPKYDSIICDGAIRSEKITFLEISSITSYSGDRNEN